MFYEQKRERIAEIINLMKEDKFLDVFHLFEVILMKALKIG